MFLYQAYVPGIGSESGRLFVRGTFTIPLISKVIDKFEL